MKRGARWLSLALVVALAFSLLGGALASADDAQGTTYTGLKATIQALVWKDGDGDGTFLGDEGSELVDGVQVALSRLESDGTTWIPLGTKETSGGGLEGTSFPAGWVGWDDVELIYPDGLTPTKFKLEVLDEINMIGGKTREFELGIGQWNLLTGKLSARFFEVNLNSDRAAFRLSDETGNTNPQPIPDPPISNSGMIQALVWDDINKDGKFVEPNGQWSVEELIDDVTVNLYRKEGDGWVLHASARSGPGGYFPFSFPHGWVGFKDLPVVADFSSTTEYKLELVTDRTFAVVGDSTRIAPLNYSNLWSFRFFNVQSDAADRAFLIKSQSVSISGTVWYDANADQVREWHEPGCAGWTVVITDLFNRTVATATTDSTGYYRVRGLKSGTYKVWVKKVRGWNQVYPYYKLLTIPPWGCEKGHHLVVGKAGSYYVNKDFGMLNMKQSVWAPLYYSLWLIGLLQYQL